MLSERHEKDAIKKALTEADEKNEELLMKVEDANEKIEHLQTMINKCVASLVLIMTLSILYMYPIRALDACLFMGNTVAIQ